jgi:hypothetical protein
MWVCIAQAPGLKEWAAAVTAAVEALAFYGGARAGYRYTGRLTTLATYAFRRADDWVLHTNPTHRQLGDTSDWCWQDDAGRLVPRQPVALA